MRLKIRYATSSLEIYEQTNTCQPPDIRPSTHGNRGVRFPGGAGPGYALVVESCHRRSVAAARSRRCGSSRITPGSSCRRSRATRLERVLADPAFRKNVDDLVQARRQAAEAPAWFQQNHPQAPLTCVAYFSMEFMLSEALAHLFGRARQRGRRSAQGRQRSGRAGGRRGAALPARLFSPGDRQGRSATGALSRTTIPDSCRSRRCASRTASGCGWRSPCPVTRSGCAPGRSRSAE